jgi:hypothetical protein
MTADAVGTAIKNGVRSELLEPLDGGSVSVVGYCEMSIVAGLE